MTSTHTGTDPRVEDAKQWKPEYYTQNIVPHVNIDLQQTEYAVVKFADMSEKMQ